MSTAEHPEQTCRILNRYGIRIVHDLNRCACEVKAQVWTRTASDHICTSTKACTGRANSPVQAGLDTPAKIDNILPNQLYVVEMNCMLTIGVARVISNPEASQGPTTELSRRPTHTFDSRDRYHL